MWLAGPVSERRPRDKSQQPEITRTDPARDEIHVKESKRRKEEERRDRDIKLKGPKKKEGGRERERERERALAGTGYCDARLGPVFTRNCVVSTAVRAIIPLGYHESRSNWRRC